MPSALKVVGDRYTLRERQRLAVSRAAYSDAAQLGRLSTMIPANGIAGQSPVIDGYDVLIALEAALSRGVILACRDGYYRDLASFHGSYHSVSETGPAIRSRAAFAESVVDFQSAMGLDTWIADRKAGGTSH